MISDVLVGGSREGSDGPGFALRARNGLDCRFAHLARDDKNGQGLAEPFFYLGLMVRVRPGQLGTRRLGTLFLYLFLNLTLTSQLCTRLVGQMTAALEISGLPWGPCVSRVYTVASVMSVCV